MGNSNKLLCFCVFFAVVQISAAVLSDAAIEQSRRLFKNLCKNKWKVSEEEFVGAKNGDFSESRAFACYASCALGMMKVMTNGQINLESARNQLNSLMPEKYKKPMTIQLDACHTVVGADGCSTAAAFVRCAYKTNPNSPVIPL